MFFFHTWVWALFWFPFCQWNRYLVWNIVKLNVIILIVYIFSLITFFLFKYTMETTLSVWYVKVKGEAGDIKGSCEKTCLILIISYLNIEKRIIIHFMGGYVNCVLWNIKWVFMTFSFLWVGDKLGKREFYWTFFFQNIKDKIL